VELTRNVKFIAAKAIVLRKMKQKTKSDRTIGVVNIECHNEKTAKLFTKDSPELNTIYENLDTLSDAYITYYLN
jgi:hypothetical protein